MDTNVSGKKTKRHPQTSGVDFPAQGCELTLDHFAASADSTAQDHTEDHAKYHHHRDADAHCTNDVELVVEDLFDGIRAGLNLDAFENVLFGADVRDKLLHTSSQTTTVQRVVDGFQCVPLGLILGLELVVGVLVKFLDFLNHLILV